MSNSKTKRLHWTNGLVDFAAERVIGAAQRVEGPENVKRLHCIGYAPEEMFGSGGFSRCRTACAARPGSRCSAGVRPVKCRSGSGQPRRKQAERD